jgi:hypothetical protein
LDWHHFSNETDAILLLASCTSLIS